MDVGGVVSERFRGFKQETSGVLPVLPVGLWKISLFAIKLIFSFGNRSAEVESNFREMAATYAGFPDSMRLAGATKVWGFGFSLLCGSVSGFRLRVLVCSIWACGRNRGCFLAFSGTWQFWSEA